MPNDHSFMLRIRGDNGVVGAGFVAGPQLAITCAHVVNQTLGRPADSVDVPCEPVAVDFPHTGLGGQVRMLAWPLDDGWRPLVDGKMLDVAILRLERDLPMQVGSPTLRRMDRLGQTRCRACGFPKGHDHGLWASARLIGRLDGGLLVQVTDSSSRGPLVLPGFSGAPVYDDTHDAVVGMVVGRERDEQLRTAYMIPVDVLAKCWPPLTFALELATVSADRPNRQWKSKAGQLLLSGRRRVLWKLMRWTELTDTARFMSPEELMVESTGLTREWSNFHRKLGLIMSARRHASPHGLPKNDSSVARIIGTMLIDGMVRWSRRAIQWMNAELPQEANLCILTGPEESGKSAVLSYLALACDQFCNRLWHEHALDLAALRTVRRPIDLCIDARGKATREIATEIAGLLNVPATSPEALIALASNASDRRLIVIDGIDEAIDSRLVIRQLIRPLTSRTPIRVLLSVRPQLRSEIGSAARIRLESGEFNDLGLDRGIIRWWFVALCLMFVLSIPTGALIPSLGGDMTTIAGWGTAVWFLFWLWGLFSVRQWLYVQWCKLEEKVRAKLS